MILIDPPLLYSCTHVYVAVRCPTPTSRALLSWCSWSVLDKLHSSFALVERIATPHRGQLQSHWKQGQVFGFELHRRLAQGSVTGFEDVIVNKLRV